MLQTREPQRMPRNPSGCLVQSLESLFDGRSVAGLSDRQLLDRFTRAHDAAGEAAFTALVARHGPMVLDLCHQLLGDLHHAEDAFQAVFLVLARKARSIRDPDLLANWLYGVALRTARCAKVQLNRRRKKEEAGLMRRLDPGSSALLESMFQPAFDHEQAEALHSEIARLPATFRKPVILCYLESLTLDEAACRLRCPAGTVRSRIARARQKLKRALSRRGVVLPAAALAAVLSPRSASASLSPKLCEATARAAFQFAAGQAAAPFAEAVAHEILRSTMLQKLTLATFALLFVGALASGVNYFSGPQSKSNQPTIPPAVRPMPSAAQSNPASPKPAPGRMFVVGRVVDPLSNPVPGATVITSARTKFDGNGGAAARGLTLIGQVDADPSGSFRLDASRTSSSRNDEVMAIALAPGFGAGWTRIDPDAGEPRAVVALQPEQLVRGRLLNVSGQPVQDVVVSVAAILRPLVLHPEQPDRLRRHTEGPRFSWELMNNHPGWPKPATTDSDGRFTIRGLGRGCEIQLGITDQRFARQMIEIPTNDAAGDRVAKATLQPAQIISGRVTLADTGAAVSHAMVRISSTGTGQRAYRSTSFQTDSEGRFRANPAAGELFAVSASPPPGHPYLRATKRIEWSKGAITHSVDLALPRGVLIRGTVVEEGSERPVTGASVYFNSHSRAVDSNDIGSQSETAGDGSFAIAVRPGPGCLAVLAPNEDYVLREIGNREFFNGQPGGSRLYSHGFQALDPQSAGPALEVRIALRRGAVVSGRVVGPEDKPVSDAWIMSSAALGPSALAWRIWQANYHATARGGRFELHGLAPDTGIPVFFFDPKAKLGAVAHLSGKMASGGPITIRLEPCGTAIARLVDSEKRPVARFGDEFLILMTITPGPDLPSSNAGVAKKLSGQAGRLSQIDPINYARDSMSDLDGRIVFPALIPGATYRVFSRPAVRQPSDPSAHKDFTVKPGETVNLGEILIAKPPAR